MSSIMGFRLESEMERERMEGEEVGRIPCRFPFSMCCIIGLSPCLHACILHSYMKVFIYGVIYLTVASVE